MGNFFRIKEGSYIGGVCTGLGAYTNIDPIFWRIIFIFLPSGFWIYLLMWALTKKQ